jgi:hypothetical protein
LPEGRAEELNEALVGELLAVEAFELAVVEEEVAGDSDAEGDFGGGGYGYLDRGALVLRWMRVCLVGSGPVVAFVSFGTPGYLDNRGFVVGAFGLLAHWAHSEVRITRYQILCRVGRRAERAFVFARLPLQARSLWPRTASPHFRATRPLSEAVGAERNDVVVDSRAVFRGFLGFA